MRWHGQIVESYRVVASGTKTLGFGADIHVPESGFSGVWGLLRCADDVILSTNQNMRLEVLRDDVLVSVPPGEYKLTQSDVYVVHLDNGISLKIRFAPESPSVIFASPLILGISEALVVVAAVIFSLLVAWVITVKSPEPVAEEGVMDRQAEVIFTKTIKQIENERAQSGPVSDEKNQKNAPKTETKESTPTPAVRDVKKTGLLAALGGDTRSNLQQVNEGSKELIGAGGKTSAAAATTFGSGGVADSLDSRLKDTGSGRGTGTTYGIAGVGTKGRSSGSGSYGTGSGLGGKESVQISAGGTGESFAGTIDKEAVRRVVKSALSQIKACYEREYRKNSQLSGKLVISWEIHAQGVAKNARVVKDKSTLSNAAVEDCVKIKILGLRFPEPPVGAAAEITYPFIFIPDK